MSKKYAFVSLSLTLLTFLLLSLAGCDSSSDPKVYYQATGSWSGTIGADQVRGIIAPDGSAQLAIVDVNGEFIADAGEYVGRIGSVNPDNIGSMSLTRLQAGVSSGQNVTFKLTADRLYSEQGIELTRTSEANTAVDNPAEQGDVAGHWSFLTDAVITNVVVDANGNISGGDRVNCQYSGSLNLIDPVWNIYNFNLSTSSYPGKSCLDAASFNGLAMKLIEGEPRPLLWFSVNSGTKSFVGAWTETINVDPVAQMAILGERPDQSVLVVKNFSVELDGGKSSDGNLDLLSYEWKITDLLSGNTLILPGNVVEFVPDINVDNNSYKIELVVSDGITTTTTPPREIKVVWTDKRFINRLNGTVLDTKTQLIWLQDAGCFALNLLDGVEGQWGVNTDNALAGVAALRSGSACLLNDGSAAGDWDVPTLKEFREIMAEIPYARAPALINDAGTGLWVEGVDSFTNVAKSNSAIIPFYYYWAKEDAPTAWFYIDFSYTEPEKWYSSDILGINSVNTVWPVRVLRAGESDMSGL